jgi:hypothetical protein
MSRSAVLARLERDRLRAAEARGRARAEALAVSEGVSETVSLSESRGAAFETPVSGARARPVRRLTGLEWLVRRGRLNSLQQKVGERYGLLYRRATAAGKIGSSLNLDEGGPGMSMTAVVGQAEARAVAMSKLAELRRRLSGHSGLIGACDRICGDELTPREAAGGDRDAVRLEAVLEVALDLLDDADSSSFVLDACAGLR